MAAGEIAARIKTLRKELKDERGTCGTLYTVDAFLEIVRAGTPTRGN